MSKVIKARSVIVENKKISHKSVPDKKQEQECITQDDGAKELLKMRYEIKQQISDEIRIEIIKETQQEVDKIINEAKVEAEAIKAESLEESNKIKEEAYQTAYEEGFKEATNKVKEEFEPFCQQTKTLIEELSIAKEKYLTEQENEITKLVLTITEKILGTIVENRPEVIAQIVRKVIVRINSAEKISIKVNPLHIPYLSNYREQYPELPHDRMEIMEDPNIKPGDCLVVTENGFIDSKIEEQLELIKQTILEVADYVELS